MDRGRDGMGWIGIGIGKGGKKFLATGRAWV